MGLFDKIKTILFEDDGEDDIPVFSKEDIAAEKNREEVKVHDEVVEPMKTEETSRFKNIKRDFDFKFDEDELLGEIKEKEEEKVKEEVVEVKVEEPKVEVPEVVKQPEKKEVFLNFDEDEFERLNSRINRNEERAKKEIRRDYSKTEEDPMIIARRANNNFSSTTPTVNTKDVLRRDADRYKITDKDTRKPFTPSPVISPVYGILDKNYTKDSIVDKKDGMKRERVKPIKTEVVLNSEIEKEAEKRKAEEEKIKKEKKTSIDLVRQKAYGALEENVLKLEEDINVKEKSNVVLTTVGEQEDFIEFQEQFGDDIIDDAMMAVANYNVDKFEKTIENIEDEVEEDLNKTKVQHYDNSIKEIKSVSEEENKNRLLDDLEKTSTLQILDDIEKELSSIKPISKSYQNDESDYQTATDDTLENDLFNLIDSMYEQGEEDEDE